MPPRWRKLLIAVGPLILAGTFWLVYWSSFSRSKDIRCIGNLQTIRTCTMQWITTHNGLTPSSLASLAQSENLPPRVFICPASGSEPRPGEFVCDYDSAFDRAGGPVASSEAGDSTEIMLVWDKKPFHRQAGKECRYVLFVDGQVSRLSESEFQQALEKLDRVFPPHRP